MRVWILQAPIIAGCAGNTEGKNIQQNTDDLLKVDIYNGPILYMQRWPELQ